MNWLSLLFKAQALLFILMKVSLLIKYFLFVKYRSADWKAHHLIFFPENEIIFSKSLNCVKAKKTQNLLSNAFVHFLLLVIITRLAIKVLYN